MLIKALCDYHDVQEQKRGGGSDTDEYFGSQNVQYMIFLTTDGQISQIADIQQPREMPQKNGKVKTVLAPREITLPKRSQKTSIDLNIIEHRPLYIFGLDYQGGALTAESGKAQKSHSMFTEGNIEFFQGLQSEIALAYLRFLQNWNPPEQTENPHLVNLRGDYSKSYYCFALDGHPEIMLHEDSGVIQKYIDLKQQQEQEREEGIYSMCPIEGERLRTARIHDKIKGLRGGNTTGGVLVGIKESAFESYGKEQSYNSSISETAMKKYTRALNGLLQSDGHRRTIGNEFTMVYFAIDKGDKIACDAFAAMMYGSNDEKLERALSSVVREIAQGRTGDMSALGVNEDIQFYVAGLAPNSSRISQKFVIRDSFGSIMRNAAQHQADMQVRPDGKQVYINWMLETLLPPKDTKKVTPPPLAASVLTAILNGTNYPPALLETVVRRIKTDSDEEKNKFIKINDLRIGIIKASLNRKARFLRKKEDITMALDVNNTNQAYLCGRLFAVLEKVQQDSAGGKLNRTIKDSYFASACVRPATVFPKLLMLSQNHLSKLDRPFFFNKLIGEICSPLGGSFPSTLPLDEQGRFIIGYYHQNNALYTKREDKENNNTSKEENV